jgi:hypothetical protein
LWIATLNFDNAIETAADTAGLIVDAGLTRSSGVIRFKDESSLSLAKLHGSLDWELDQPWSAKTTSNPSANSHTIFGAGNKLRMNGPFLDLLLRFREALDRTDLLEVCGYSFRDPHVNYTILRWLSFDSSRRVNVFDQYLSMERLIGNINANIGIVHPTGQQLVAQERFLKEAIALSNISAKEWASDSTSSARN